MVFPVFLASAVPSIFEFFVVDGFGEGILENKEAVSVFETFILVMSFMGAAIVFPIFAVLNIKDLEVQKKAFFCLWSNAFTCGYARLHWYDDRRCSSTY